MELKSAFAMRVQAEAEAKHKREREEREMDVQKDIERRTAEATVALQAEKARAAADLEKQMSYLRRKEAKERESLKENLESVHQEKEEAQSASHRAAVAELEAKISSLSSKGSQLEEALSQAENTLAILRSDVKKREAELRDLAALKAEELAALKDKMDMVSDDRHRDVSCHML